MNVSGIQFCELVFVTEPNVAPVVPTALLLCLLPLVNERREPESALHEAVWPAALLLDANPNSALRRQNTWEGLGGQ